MKPISEIDFQLGASSASSENDVDHKVLPRSIVNAVDSLPIDRSLPRDTLPSALGPVVIPFGPPQVGKSSVIGRVVNYTLHEAPPEHLMSWNVASDPLQNQSNDQYKDASSQLIAALTDTDHDIGGTNTFYVLRASSCKPNSPKVWQILEVPGEHYFDVDKPDAPIAQYLRNVLNAYGEDRIFMFLFSPNLFYGHPQQTILQEKYAKKVAKQIEKLQSNDKFMIVLTQVDTCELYRAGVKQRDLVKKYFGSSGRYSAVGAAFDASPRLKSYHFIKTKDTVVDGATEWGPYAHARELTAKLIELARGKSFIKSLVFWRA